MSLFQLPKATIITSFYNDRELLPWWLTWHRRLFDNGILIDWDSTDESVEICRRLCPDWKIVKSRYKFFNVTDHNAMQDEVEDGVTGWKGSLNTTEFLFHYDFKAYLDTFEQTYPDIPAVMTTRINAIETPEERYRTYTGDPLIDQITHGEICPTEGRIFHKANNGQYLEGRHGTELPYIQDSELYDVKFRWAPYKILIRRIQNFKEKMTPEEQSSPKCYHTRSPEWWTNDCNRVLTNSQDLLNIPAYRKIYDGCSSPRPVPPIHASGH